MNYQAGKEFDPVFKEVVIKHFHRAQLKSGTKFRASWEDLTYYAYPCTFGSTAGPHEGMGGCAMSMFTIHAFVSEMTGDAVLFCAGKYKYMRSWEAKKGWGK